MLLVAALLLWGPGALLGRALGMRRRWALVAAPGLTWGAVTLAAVAVPRLGLRWTTTTAAASLAVLLLAAVLLRRWRSRPPPPQTERSGARSWAAAGAGCAVAAAVVVVTAWRAGHPLGGTAQTWDAVYHANLTTMIATTGDSDPVSAPSALASAGWRDVDTYYPDALHALAALVVRLTGAGAASVLDVVLVLSSAVVLPVAAAALAATVAPGAARGARAHRGTAAGVAAAVSVLPTAFPVDQWWRGVWSYGLSLTAGVLAAALVLRALQGPRSRLGPGVSTPAAVALAGLVLLGVTGLQPAGTVLAGLLVLGWALGRLVGAALAAAATRPRPPRPLVGLGAALVGTALLPVLVLGLARWSPELGSLASYDYTSRSGSPASVARTTWRVLGMLRRVLPAYGYEVPAQSGQGVLAVVVVLAALVLVVARGARWLVAVWLVLLAAAVSTVAPVGGVLTPAVAAALRAVTLFSYGAPFRLMAVVAVVSAVLVGVAAGVVVPVVAGRLAHRRVALRVVAGALVVVLGGVLVGESLARTPVRLAAGYAPRVTGPDQRAVMDALADRLATDPLPPGATVANDPVDGSPWLYALHGAPVLFRHYSAGEVTPPARVLLDRLDDVDTDPAVQQALRDLRVCYVYASDTRVQDSQPTAAGFADLQGAASLELVARQGGASAYRVLVPGTPCA